MILHGRKIYPGVVQGETLVTSQGVSFFGGVDPESGVVVERGHELEGQSIAGKILVFPSGKGSTVGSYTLYRLKANGLAPLAIVNAECETITAVGCIIAELPCVDRIDLQRMRSGQIARLDGEAGLLEILGPAWPPAPLRGDEPGSFAEDTLSRRLPDIARRVLEDEDWPPEGRKRLQDLIDEMPHGLIRPIIAEGAPDLDLWEAWLPPFLGQSWLEAPWFAAEVYFFRRILEATGYFRPGPAQGVDPYRLQKLEGLKGVLDQLGPLCAALEGAPGGGARSDAAAGLAVVGLLRSVIWGNQADLSVWPADGDQPANHSDDQRSAHLLADDSLAFADFLAHSQEALPRVDFILDNVGLELAYDLLLADFLLGSGKASTVRFYVKPFPTYVSDATSADVWALAAYVAGAEDEASRRLGLRLRGYLTGLRLELQTDPFWVSPLAGWEMPPETRRELGSASLLVSKGDANYRRWLGDRHWPFTTPIAEILVYRPAPLLLLRVLKSEIVAGLKPGQAEEMDQKDPEWLYNRSWGVIQFTS